MPRFVELSLAAQTAYAELLHQARALDLSRTVATLNGSFAHKTVKGTRYWYFAYRDIDGSVRQLYVGPDDERVRQLIERFRTDKAVPIAPFARSAIALGCADVVPRHFRIVRRLAEYGFFHGGGILIGTHAFLSLGNMLGVRFTDGARTLDVDLAHAGKNLSVALPANIHVDAHGALQSLEMGFLPIAELHGAMGATYINPRDPELRIDFLTSTARVNGVVHVPNLNVALQPLKFMEFSLEGTTQAAVFSAEGAVVVNIPAPARFAIHKLLVFGERKGAFRIKASKDLLQAAALIEYLHQLRPDELQDAWEDARSRGSGWRSRLKEGRNALENLKPPVDAVKALKLK